MYMGRVGSSSESEIVRELHGARVVLTGLSATSGVDVVRAFADITARLVPHTTALSPQEIEKARKRMRELAADEEAFYSEDPEDAEGFDDD